MKIRSLFTARNARRFQAHQRNLGRASSRLEQLEKRTLLAGDVTALLRSQSAFIEGDASDNSIEVTIADGDVVLQGLDGTTINGSTNAFVIANGVTSVDGQLHVELNGGDDRLSIGGVNIGGSVFIGSGSGDDQVGIHSSTTIGGDLLVDGDRGRDEISLQDSTVNGSAVLLGRRGSDTIVASSATVGRDLIVLAGRGHDDGVVDDSSIGRNLYVAGHRGNDDVVVRDSNISNRLHISGHRGNDVVVLDTSTVGGRSRIAGGGGRDNVVVEGETRTSGLTRIIGGARRDRLDVSPDANLRKLRRHSFSNSSVSASVLATRITDTSTGAIPRAEAIVAEFGSDLMLSVDNTTVSEDSGTGTATITVSRSSDSSVPLDVRLTSSNVDRLTIQQSTVTIPAGQTSVDVLLDAEDNTALDGDSTVTITASSGTASIDSATIAVVVTDDETGSLTLTPASTSVPEDTGGVNDVGNANTVSIQVQRSGSQSAAQTINLNYTLANNDSASAIATGPSEVVIPANSDSASVTFTTVPGSTVNGDTVVTVTASSAGTADAITNITVLDNDAARLTVESSDTSLQEGGSATIITVTRNTATTDDLPVILTSNNTDRLNFNDNASIEVVIPAGQTSATQTVTAFNDSLVNGDVNVTLTASATGLSDGTATISVQDNDVAGLGIVLPSTNIVAENAGTNALTATLSRNSGDISSALTVNLSSTGDSRLSVPATVTIPAGQRTVDVSFDAVDNNVVDNPRTGTATVTATSAGFTNGTATISITDDDFATVALTPSSLTVNEDAGTATMTLARNSSAAAETVALGYSDTTLITGPQTITFAAGDNTRTFQVTIVDNNLLTDNADVTVTATTPGHPDATATVAVTNDDMLSLSTDFSSNTTVESVQALVTKNAAFTVTGTTVAGATVEIDTDGDAGFDEGSTVADTNGNYTFNVQLTHTDANDGLNRLQVRASETSSGVSTTSDITNVHLAVGTVVRFAVNHDFDTSGSNDFYDVELFDTDAPLAVANFLSYAGDGSYDNVIVHRSPPGFVIQGGGLTVENTTVSRIATRASITGEFTSANSNERGTLSMAHSGSPDSGTSQWFVNVSPNNGPSLDAAEHTVFGAVIGGGMSVVDAINAVDTADLSFALGLGVPQTGVLAQTPVARSPFETLSGSIAITNNSDVIVGTNTLFTTELQVGDIIEIQGAQLRVAQITSDTRLVIDVQAATDDSGLTISRVVPPPAEDYIVFTSIGEILDSI